MRWHYNHYIVIESAPVKNAPPISKLPGANQKYLLAHCSVFYNYNCVNSSLSIFDDVGDYVFGTSTTQTTSSSKQPTTYFDAISSSATVSTRGDREGIGDYCVCVCVCMCVYVVTVVSEGLPHSAAEIVSKFSSQRIEEDHFSVRTMINYYLKSFIAFFQ